MERQSKWAKVTPKLLFACFCFLVGDMLFGFDTGSFGGLLANPGFIRSFGEFNATKNAYAISTVRISLLSSLAFVGKFLGCLVSGPLIEKLGHRKVFYLLSVLSFIGVIIEITAAGNAPGSGRPAQFIAGRIMVYGSVGLVEVCVTTYQSEIVPAQLRGFVVISLQLFLAMGQVLATGLNKAFSGYTSTYGWRTVTGIQFIFPTLICICVPFIPHSPRWLLSKGRDDDAAEALKQIRPREDAASGKCEAEILSIKEGLASHVEKGKWSDLVKGSNLRRTTLVLVFYTFQQITGQAFFSTYQTVFYRQNGFADKAFLYPIISTVLAAISVLFGMYIIEYLGRRPLFLLSAAMQALFMFLLAGLGAKKTRTETENRTIVAAFMLFTFSYNLGWGGGPYVIGAEVPTGALREKTASIGTSLNVFWAWLTNFVLPYMLAAMTFKVGYIFGGISILACLYTFLYLPETRGKSLEEMDWLFSQPYSPFRARKDLPPARQSASASGSYEMKQAEEGREEGFSHTILPPKGRETEETELAVEK